MNIQSKLSISKNFFSSSDYLHIKEFYDLVSAKKKELIVLEKVYRIIRIIPRIFNNVSRTRFFIIG